MGAHAHGGRVRVPAHAVNSDHFPTDVEANRRHFAAYDVTLMTGVGHYLMLEDPARFSDLLELELPEPDLSVYDDPKPDTSDPNAFHE